MLTSINLTLNNNLYKEKRILHTFNVGFFAFTSVVGERLVSTQNNDLAVTILCVNN